MESGRPVLGIAAVVAAFAALGLAIIPQYAGQPLEQQTETVSRTLFKVGKKYIDKKAGVEETRQRNLPMLAAVILGIGALALAVAGWLRREDRRFAIAAGVIAVAAIAWEFLVLALVVGIVLVIMIAFLYHADFA